MENENEENSEAFVKKYEEKLKPFGFELYKEPILTEDGFLILNFENKDKKLFLEIIVEVEDGSILATLYKISSLGLAKSLGFANSEEIG